jgi:predicted transcriptional regulator
LTCTIILCYIVLQQGGAYKMKDTITIRLPEKLQKELEIVVKAEKTSKSEIIRDAVARYLASRRFQQLRKKVLPFAEAQGLITDEDVFKAIS